MAKPVIVGPTSEQGKRMHIRVIEAKGVGIVGHQDTRECLLDALLADGGLTGSDGDTEAARRRHEAGVWLRTLHDATGLQASQTGSYAPASDTSTGEMSDEQSEAWGAYTRTMRALNRDLSGVARFIESVCVWDQAPGRPHMMAMLRFGLDRLARLRGL